MYHTFVQFKYLFIPLTPLLVFGCNCKFVPKKGTISTNMHFFLQSNITVGFVPSKITVPCLSWWTQNMWFLNGNSFAMMGD